MNSRQKTAFLLSLLLHVLLLSGYVLTWHYFPPVPPERQEPLPAYYVPSDTLSENSQMAQPSLPQAKTTPDAPKKEPKPEDKNGIEKKEIPLTPTAATTSPSKAQTAEVSKKSKDNDGVHLIGDKKMDKPLIKLLGTALSRSLIYPKIAIDFNLRGTTYVGFTLQPNGVVENPQVVKSSGEEVLDQEARRAVGAMSPVVNVNQYLDKPKYLVVGIIFG